MADPDSFLIILLDIVRDDEFRKAELCPFGAGPEDMVQIREEISD